MLAESQGLIMVLNGEVTQNININNYLGDSFSTFTLKEVSSANGRDLFLRDLNTYYDDIGGIYDNADVARDNVGIIKFRPAVQSDYNSHFIYFSFTLQASNCNRYLIFDRQILT